MQTQDEHLFTQQFIADFTAKRLHKLPEDIVTRNIIPFAGYQFENIIEDFGNTRGPEIMRDVLSLKFSRLSENEQESLSDFIKVFIVPNNSMFQHAHTGRNSIARALFALAICKKLQEHYVTMQASLTSKDFAKIQWIPAWTQNYARQVEEAFTPSLYKENQSKTTKNLLPALALSLLLIAGYSYRLGRGQEYQKLAMLSLVIFAMHFFRLVLDKCIGQPLRRHQINIRNEEDFGPAFNIFKEMQTEITSKKFNQDSKNENILIQPLADMLYDRSSLPKI